MKQINLLASFCLLAAAYPLLAQSSSQEASSPPANILLPSETPTPTSEPASRVMPAGTIVAVTPLQEITSKRVEVGQTYNFQVVNDVVEGGVVVIPRGATATGLVSWKTGRAIGGKSGKFDIEFQSVSVNGRTIPLMGTHRQEGRGNTVGALLGSILISGRSAVMLPGQIVNAVTKEPAPY